MGCGCGVSGVCVVVVIMIVLWYTTEQGGSQRDPVAIVLAVEGFAHPGEARTGTGLTTGDTNNRLTNS